MALGVPEADEAEEGRLWTVIVYFSGSSSAGGRGLPETLLKEEACIMLSFIDTNKGYKPNSRFQAVLASREKRKARYKSSCGTCKLAPKCDCAWDVFNIGSKKRIDCLATK
jgi:hypothetical protein